MLVRMARVARHWMNDKCPLASKLARAFVHSSGLLIASVSLRIDHEVTDDAEELFIAFDEAVQGCLEGAVLDRVFGLLSVRIISFDKLRLGNSQGR